MWCCVANLLSWRRWRWCYFGTAASPVSATSGGNVGQFRCGRILQLTCCEFASDCSFGWCCIDLQKKPHILVTGNWNQSSKPSQPWQLKHILDPHRAASASLPPFCLPVEGIHGADGCYRGILCLAWCSGTHWPWSGGRRGRIFFFGLNF